MTDIYDRFLALPWKYDFSTHPKPEDSYLECVIVEPRRQERLAGVLRNMSAMIPYAALTIICSKDNVDFVMGDIIGPGTNIRVIPYFAGNITRDEYSEFMLSPKLWGEILISPKILVFQTDSGIIKNRILEFIHYDYIGAPWPWAPNQGGNGGFSLRSRKLMYDICSYFDTSCINPPEEDVVLSFFCRMFDPSSIRLPSTEMADKFSMEYNYHEDPLGFHQAYNIHPRDTMERILLQFNEATEAPMDIKSAMILCTNGLQLKHPLLLSFVHLGISHHHDGIVLPSSIPMPSFLPPLAEPAKLAIQIGGHDDLFFLVSDIVK